MTVDARHLRAFLAVVEEGTITRAAERLHVTQPALSRTLRQLETHLGVRLIDRSTHHLAMTAAGEAYHPRAAAAVSALDGALDPVLAERQPLRLSYSWAALGALTAPLVRDWTHDHPDAPVELHRIDDRLAGLLEGRADVAIVRGVGPLNGVHRLELGREDRLVALPAGHPLSERPEVALDDLVGETLVLNVVSGTTSLELWPSDRRPERIVRVNNTDEWLLAVATGTAVGVTVRSSESMYADPHVTYRLIHDAPTVSLSLMWLEPPSHPGCSSFASYVREKVSGAAGLT
jgi:DNA-binding transcriptional LysR family regulator